MRLLHASPGETSVGLFISLSSSPFVEPCCPQHDEKGRLPLPGHSECVGSSKGWQGVLNELLASGLSKKLWLAEGHMLVIPSASLISNSSPKSLLIEHQGCSKVFSS